MDEGAEKNFAATVRAYVTRDLSPVPAGHAELGIGLQVDAAAGAESRRAAVSPRPGRDARLNLPPGAPAVYEDLYVSAPVAGLRSMTNDATRFDPTSLNTRTTSPSAIRYRRFPRSRSEPK